MNDSRQLLTPVTESDGRFKPLKTTPIYVVYFMASLALEITAIAYAIIHPDIRNKCREYFILIYMHVSFWFLTLVMDFFLRLICRFPLMWDYFLFLANRLDH